MQHILIRKTSGQYYTGVVYVNIMEEPYFICNIFHRFNHKPKTKPWKVGEYILLPNYNNQSKKYNVIDGGTYKDKSLDYIHVYFNKYDFKYDNPLVMVLFFEGCDKTNNCRKFTKFKSDSTFFGSIDKLLDYTTEENLLLILIEENKRINGEIKFKIKPEDEITNLIKGYKQKIGYLFERITFVANKDTVQKSCLLNSFRLFSYGPNHIDPNVFKQFDDKNFVAIIVYYYNKNKIALLVEFIETLKKHQICRTKIKDDIHWVKENSPVQYNCTENLVDHLKLILFCLENKIIIRLDKQSWYKDNDIFDVLTEINPNKRIGNAMNVSKTCNIDLGTNSQYICYKHYLKKFYEDNIRDILERLKSSCKSKFDIYLELIPQISIISISLYHNLGYKEYIFYKPGPGPPKDSYLSVYFYEHPGNPKPDTVPLMLRFDEKFYSPCSQDRYFAVWTEKTIKTPLDISDPKHKIKTELDNANKQLNTIKIEYNIYSSSPIGSYGLLPPKDLSNLFGNHLPDFNTNRIQVTTQKIRVSISPLSSKPSLTKDNTICKTSIYTKYTHTTINKFQLGPIKYKGSEVKYTENGKPPSNGGTEIQVQPGYNLLEVYYLATDTEHKYPLLIGIGKQTTEEKNEKKVADTDYYKLKTVGTPPGTKASDYKWEKDQSAGTKVKTKGNELVDYLNGINYQVKKVLKIELNKQSQYQAKVKNGSEVQQRSNGNGFSQINNGQNGNNQIEVVECVECKRVQESRYKCFCHKLTKLKSVNDIGGLKFYIPQTLSIQNGSSRSENNGQEINLHNTKQENKEDKKPGQNGQSPSSQSTDNGKLDKIYYNQCMGDVYVYFYDEDPRPLLICFGSTAYKPKKLPESNGDGQYNYSTDGCKNWTYVEEIKSCLCDTDEELEVLIGVLTEVYFGNAFIKFFSEYWIEISAGSGSGVVGLGGVAGGGYLFYAYFDNIRWLI